MLSKDLLTNRAGVTGLLALSAAGAVAATGTAAHADVFIYNSGLTTSIAPGDTASNNDVFFDFVSGASSKDSSQSIQYRLNSTATSATALSADSNASILVDSNGNCNATRYAMGDRISTTDNLFRAPIYGQGSSTNFALGDTGYLGMTFASSGNTLFGWANITLNNDTTVTLNNFGYESTPGTPTFAGGSAAVAVPEANPLELLLLGAVGLGAYRMMQKKPVAA